MPQPGERRPQGASAAGGTVGFVAAGIGPLIVNRRPGVICIPVNESMESIMRSSTRALAAIVSAGVLAATVLAPASASKRVRHEPPPAPAIPNYDTIGSIAYDGHGFGYNRITGERYYKCMYDQGYGRVRPCDAGDGGRN
jgi:hypothetical protein